MAGTVGRKRLELFLDLYKQIEDVLEEKYRNSRRHYTSAVYEFIKDYESAPVRDKLDICRHIRNLMAHSANMDGEPVVVPSQPVVDALQEVLDFVSRPPLALEYATKGERVLKVGPNQKVLRVMELMEKNGWITRQSVGEDARLKKIQLTPQAIELHERVVACIHKTEEQLAQGLTPEEKEEFFRLCDKIRHNAEQAME